MSGRKDDAGKVDLSLVPMIAIVRLAEAMAVGEKKYGRYNYCKGLKASQQVGALLRHVFAWFNGEDFDSKDGQHHLGSAMANCLMILRQEELGTLIDDRFTIDSPEGEEGAEGEFQGGMPDEGLVLIELANGPGSTMRMTTDGELIFGLANSLLPFGSMVWARRDDFGALEFVQTFDGVAA